MTIIRILLTGFFLLLLCACSGSTDNDASSQQDAGQQQNSDQNSDQNPGQSSDGAPSNENEFEENETEEEGLGLEDGVADVPGIDRVALVAADAAFGYIELQALIDGQSIDLGSLPSREVNIIAVSEGQSDIGSVHFLLSGAVELERTENNPSYTLASAADNFDLGRGDLGAGDYTLTITPYELADGGGEAGLETIVSFSLTGQFSESGQDEQEEPAVNVADILSLQLVAINREPFDIVSLFPLSESGIVDLSSVSAEALNIVASSADENATGSVSFVLTAPTSELNLNRVDDSAAYTLLNTERNWDNSEGFPAAGDYTLVVTPYELGAAEGKRGESYTVNFSIERPVVLADISAEPDSYELDEDTFLAIDAELGVGHNDSIDGETDVSFTIISTTDHGILSLATDGGFNYRPDDGFSGIDSFRYQLNQGEQTAIADVTLTVIADTVAPPLATGFTAITPSADTRIIYVSQSSGADDNTCLTALSPCRSLTAAFEKTREGFPDHVYLKRGEIWRGEKLKNILRSGRSANEPAVLAFYGDDGARPRIEHDEPLYTNTSYVLQNFHFIGLEIASYKMELGHSEFTGSEDDKTTLFFLGGTENLLFEDILFTQAELLFQDWDSGQSKNVKIRRNIFTGTYYSKSAFDRDRRPSNQFIADTDGILFEENVYDYGGWHPEISGAASNQFNHNLYIQYGQNGNGVIFRRNIVVRASSHGVHGRPGGLYENNFFARNAIGLQMGYKQRPLAEGTFAIARDNVITEGESMVRGEGACTGAGLCTAALWGLRLEELGEGSVTVEGNIVAGLSSHDQWQELYGNLSRVGLTSDKEQVNYSNNHVWHWDTPTQGDEKNYVDPDRNLATYNQFLGGDNDFDDFMDAVKERPLQTWDTRYSAAGINNYIRAGFGLEEK